jgi:hypothetical protein
VKPCPRQFDGERETDVPETDHAGAGRACLDALADFERKRRHLIRTS